MNVLSNRNDTVSTCVNSTTSQPQPRARAIAFPLDKRSTNRRVLLAMLLLFLTSVAIVLLASASASAQQPEYKELPLAETYQIPEGETDRRKIREVEGRIKTARKQSETDLESGNAQTAATFFGDYILPAMTSTNGSSLSTLGQQREEFLDDFLSEKVTGAARQTFLTATVIPAMQKLAAADGFHPAVRVSAVHMLGMLDSRAKTRSALPQPSPEAFGSLVTILTSDQFPESLKVAAITGIERQLTNAAAARSAALGGDDINKATQQALAILDGTANGQDKWSQDLNYWLKKRSIQLLKAIGKPGDSGEVVDALISVLDQSAEGSVWLPFEAMTTLGTLDLSSVAPEKVSEVTVAIAQFLQIAFERESLKTQASLDALIFNNLLLEDLDLEIKGNDYRDNPTTTAKPKPPRGGIRSSPSRGSRGGGMDMDMDMEMDMGMDMDMEMDMEMGGGRGGGGRGGAVARRPEGPTVNLPTYRLNIARRTIKALAYEGRQALGKGVASFASEQDKQLIEDVVAELNIAISDSNVGIIDLANPEEEPEDFDEPQPTPSEQMIEVGSNASSRLASLLRGQGGNDAAPAGDEPEFDATQPAATAAGEPDFN